MADPTGKDEMLKVLGISKKIHLELAELEIQDHIAVVNVLVQLCQHRTATLQEQLNKQDAERARAAAFGPHSLAGVKPS